jgi:hypothetical protein
MRIIRIDIQISRTGAHYVFMWGKGTRGNLATDQIVRLPPTWQD